MLSALVIAADAAVPLSPSPEAVVRTLSSLVPAAIEGLVRDVVLAGPAGSRDLVQIADHAGCIWAEADQPGAILPAALKLVRNDMVLVLRAGRAPERRLFEELADLAEDVPRLQALRIRAAPDSVATRVLPGLSPTVGLVVMKRLLPADAPHFEALVRAARPRGTLQARLRRVG